MKGHGRAWWSCERNEYGCTPTFVTPAWKKILAKEKLAEKKLPRNVATWWNSTFKLLDVCLMYRTAVTKVTQEQENGLRKYELMRREWEIATQLCDVFFDATQFFSHEGADAPDIMEVVPAMDIIDRTLADDMLTMQDAALNPCIHVAVGLAKNTMNRYYNKTDKSAAYQIAMS
ncbi:hypothetical protein FOMPIDRAFT_62232 [Fomitopsis schrenkii]|uniref:HAT C-terminal dimerisation domain-containing protein n=1 Tax=Fomitopsis schrenkii TaxID=2126942 RepID=S8F4W7_FOMSC|nr:hypothetical protein FOMPIDRAFT_62232 [Fomitopsis schrenkii]